MKPTLEAIDADAPRLRTIADRVAWRINVNAEKTKSLARASAALTVIRAHSRKAK